MSRRGGECSARWAVIAVHRLTRRLLCARLRWPASGVSVFGTANASITEFVAIEEHSSPTCTSRGVALVADYPGGFELASNRIDPPCLASNATVYSGVGMCGCGASGAALRGQLTPDGATTALWVKPPTPPSPDAAVFASCDLTTRGGGWTTVFSTQNSAGRNDGDNSPEGLQLRRYISGLLPVLRSARSVLLAVRDATGNVAIPAGVAEMPLPEAWRFAHPSTYASEDLNMWPVAVGMDGVREARTVRFGSAALAQTPGTSAGDWCSNDWSPDAGTPDAVGNSRYAGRVCVDSSPAAMWYGWSTAHVADLCTSSDASLAEASVQRCTGARAFTLAVRNS